MNGPTEPNAEARVFAAAIRQNFLALLAEGFTEQQALMMLGTMMGSAIANNNAGGDR